MQLDHIKPLVKPLLSEVDAFIKAHLRSDIPLINQISEHIIQAGGKRIRPTLHLLATLSLGYTGQAHIACAAIVEFIHTATLLHDDVVDNSHQRRNRPTANHLFGNAASVLVGDFLYSRAFQIMVGLQKMPIMSVLANATNLIAEGEVLQLSCKKDSNLSIHTYFQIIDYKTAKLFEASTELAAILNDATQTTQLSLAAYGRYMGVAFQIMDDVLDYQANNQKFGKNIGDDFLEGKITLPLLYALEGSEPLAKKKLQEILQSQAFTQENLNVTLQILEDSGALIACYQTALSYHEKAIESIKTLPSNPYTTALEGIAMAAVERAY